ncbi:tRNA dihydrouridine synthase DusB [Ciceribacter naphthalenivorans]|uniref:tRNA-dihydrouridine synthase n=3 Tax=Alphaproteobacteria TaxID=28211 RepID=A0A512HCU3_9HYPH|nr:tRNA dihydrouridine synthase DusB [Ciceribacter naphthalenivorans]GEO83279.1 tRNA-dihydrouridine synthase [Ciceribacter naphthalenivorans]GLR20326.1 tRNA-dihydrouridine synthase [Ciceribacter naphthalenivorans]GLT03182.1 tRNA-dihydrouridine synthase [Sphingomonas psychrolutea]
MQAPFDIGPVSIRNRVILAPMSGVSDLPFRQLAWRFGAGLVVTEMVASKELVHNAAESWSRLKGAGLTPHMVQLAGREAHWMAEAARIAEANGADIIDINMGCPAKKVIGGYSGSALMRDPDHALSLVEATVRAVKVPVTLKMRLGWDENSMNAPEIAARAQAVGVQMITVHGRTRMQFYEGQANWDAIAAVRDVVTVPLVANGDVASREDAEAIRRRSGADAVMVGRACQGRPWHAGWIAGHDGPGRGEIPALAVEHYEAMLAHYGSDVAVRHARKHVGWYLDRFAPDVPAAEKVEIMTSRDPAFVAKALARCLAQAAMGADRRREAA